MNILVKLIKIEIFAIPGDYHGFLMSEAIFDRCVELNGTVKNPTYKNMNDTGDWINDVHNGILILPECKYLKNKGIVN